MTTATELESTTENAPSRFFYGWRYVPCEHEDGTTSIDAVPLTLQDTLHPQLGDHVVEGPMHDQTRSYLTWVFRSRLVADPTAFVLSDCGIDWDDPRFQKGHCPDIAVVTGLASPAEILRGDSYPVKKFGQKPRAIVEVVSRHLRKNDVETKFHAYHELEIPLYLIVDREKSDVDWKIVAFQHTPNRYLKLANDEHGRFWVDFLGIWIGVENQKVVCYDGKTDSVIGDYVEITRQLDAEKQRAEAENQRAEAAEAKLKEAEAELARLHGQ